MVCSITRGPGKADQRARLGDMHVTQHRIGRRDAAGGRIGEHDDVGQIASRSRSTATVVRGNCISARMPSCMRAPPEAANRMNGAFFSTAVCKPLMTASPAAMPSEPPMKSKSCTAMTTGKTFEPADSRA